MLEILIFIKREHYINFIKLVETKLVMEVITLSDDKSQSELEVDKPSGIMLFSLVLNARFTQTTTLSKNSKVHKTVPEQDN